jgi:hypothetical protein
MDSIRTNFLKRALLRLFCLFWLLLLSCFVVRAQSQPIVGDFDGDGKVDVAEWNPSSRMWDVFLSCGNGLAPPVQWAGNPGTDGAVNVGDLNGDGKTDIFMWKESDHTWSVNLSTGQGFSAQSWTGMWGSDGIAPPSVPIISREQQFAEKLHAYSLPRGKRVNTRTKDLIDMVLLIQQGKLDDGRLLAAVTATFAKRGTHAVPRKREGAARRVAADLRSISWGMRSGDEPDSGICVGAGLVHRN